MLDTGVDVPEILNLVFFKAVRSYAKYWQMIGRGTRLCPDIFGPGAHKQDFLVFDCCRNIEFFNNELATAEGTIQKSQAARTLKTTLALLTTLDSPGNSQVAEADYQVLRSAVVKQLRGFVCSLNTERACPTRAGGLWRRPAPPPASWPAGRGWRPRGDISYEARVMEFR